MYEIIRNTTEPKIPTEVSDRRELFENAMTRMSNILKPDAGQDATYFIRRRVHIVSSNRAALLSDFLTRVLTLSYNLNVVFCQIKVNRLSGRVIDADIYGVPIAGFDNLMKQEGLNFLDNISIT